MRRKGYLHVYTGEGKGKTTAAMGLALRAAGAGLRVYILQFCKGRPTAEIKALGCLGDSVTIRQFGRDGFIPRSPAPEDVASAREGLREAQRIIAEGRHELVVLDEANVAIDLGMIEEKEIIDAIDRRPDWVDVVITGRNAPEALVRRADLVTEMRCVRHYFENNVPAREGIEY